MKYYRSAQVVPNKGMSYTLYELDENEEISRILTHIPDTAEVTRYPKPKMKQLFQPERLDTISAEDFNSIWDSAMS